MNEANPYESGTQAAVEAGVTSEYRPGLWLLAFVASIGGGLLGTAMPAEFVVNNNYLFGLPFATGAIFCLVASRLRAWWGFAGGAVLGAMLGFPLGDMFNFTRGPSLPVQLWAACTLGWCLACIGAVVATFVAKRIWVGIAAIFLVILIMLLLLVASVDGDPILRLRDGPKQPPAGSTPSQPIASPDQPE